MFGKLICGAVALAVGPLACARPVEVKRESPQAAIASLIKLYESKEDVARVDEVVDPAFTAMEARSDACLVPRMKKLQCDEEQLRSFKSGSFRWGGGRPSEGCPAPPMETCTCGATGSAAAWKADKFSGTSIHEALKAMHLSAKSCHIKSADEISLEGLAKLQGEFWTNACGDVEKTDPIAAVEIGCEGAPSLTFILRKKKDKWSVVDFDTATRFMLVMTGSSVRQKAHETALNEGLR